MSRLEQRIKDLESQFDEEQRRLVEAERFFPFRQLNWYISPCSPLFQCSIHETYIWDYIKVSAAHDQKDKGADLLTGGGSQEPWGGQTQNSNSPTTTCFNHSFKSAGFFHIHFLAIFEPFFIFFSQIYLLWKSVLLKQFWILPSPCDVRNFFLNGPCRTKSGQTWQACQCPNVVQKGPK